MENLIELRDILRNVYSIDAKITLADTLKFVLTAGWNSTDVIVLSNGTIRLYPDPYITNKLEIKSFRMISNKINKIDGLTMLEKIKKLYMVIDHTNEHNFKYELEDVLE